MNRSTFILAGLLAAVAGVRASAAGTDAPAAVQAAPLTRAEVKAETLRALRAGEISFGDVDRPVPVRPAAGKTRAEVRADVKAAAAAHTLTYGDSGSHPEAGIVTMPHAKGSAKARLAALSRRLGGSSDALAN